MYYFKLSINQGWEKTHGGALRARCAHPLGVRGIVKRRYRHRHAVVPPPRARTPPRPRPPPGDHRRDTPRRVTRGGPRPHRRDKLPRRMRHVMPHDNFHVRATRKILMGNEFGG